jgi:sugar phosphate isomerase/epimerase
MTDRLWSLAYLTASPLTPPEAITLAAELGYGAVGLRALPSAPGGEVSPLLADKALLAETRRRALATGVAVFDMEIIRLGPDFTTEGVKPFLEACGALSARAVLVAGDDPDEARLVAAFAEFCAAAAPYGLTADLEFMPWTPVRDCRTARRIVEASAAPNGRVLVDALHAARSTTSLEDLASLPRHLLSYGQICDAPAEIPASHDGMIHTARQERLLPGQGGIALKAMFDALPPDLPLSIEIPNVVAKAEIGVREWARLALAKARATLR